MVMRLFKIPPSRDSQTLCDRSDRLRQTKPGWATSRTELVSEASSIDSKFICQGSRGGLARLSWINQNVYALLCEEGRLTRTGYPT